MALLPRASQISVHRVTQHGKPAPGVPSNIADGASLEPALRLTNRYCHTRHRDYAGNGTRPPRPVVGRNSSSLRSLLNVAAVLVREAR